MWLCGSNTDDASASCCLAVRAKANVLRTTAENLKYLGCDHLQEEYAQLLKDYVGRPSPLYHAERLSEHYKR